MFAMSAANGIWDTQNLNSMTRDKAIELMRRFYFDASIENKAALECLIPELAECEDERIRKDLIGGLMWQRDNIGRLGPHDDNLILPGFCENVGKHLAYLEKQKEQKPAEWSEEDENALEYIHELISLGYTKKFMDGQTAADMREWVNNHVYPQPHWKPSEEQMEWLESAVKLSTDKPHIHGIIISLYEQLKRL